MMVGKNLSLPALRTLPNRRQEQPDPGTLTAVRSHLQQLRRSAGYKSQEEFAAALGLAAEFAKDTVGRWERGQANFSISSLARICRLLNVSADQLLNLPPRPVTGFCVIRKDYLDRLRSHLQAALDAIDIVQSKSDPSRVTPPLAPPDLQGESDG